ncbi:MAG: PQQ-binding-like beta-propeller repeat protein [Actinomycetota bacterium]
MTTRQKLTSALIVLAIASPLLVGSWVAALPVGTSLPLESWLARYDGIGHSGDWGNDMKIAPDGSRVFVTGETWTGSDRDFLTVAYTSGGSQLWTNRFVPGQSARALDVSPDGNVLVVTGFGPWMKIVTVAINAVSGTTLWSHSYANPHVGVYSTWDEGKEVLFSSDGTKVVIAGSAKGPDGSTDFVALGLDASTGSELWRAGFGSATKQDEYLSAAAVSADSTRLYLAGSTGLNASADMALVAFDMATGTKTWDYLRDLDSRRDAGTGLAIGSDGLLYFAGAGQVGGDTFDHFDSFVTALRPNGEVKWERRDAALPGVFDAPGGLTFVPGVGVDDGLLVSGGGVIAFAAPYHSAGLVVARDPQDGSIRWTWDPSPALFESIRALVPSPDGGSILALGSVDLGTGWDYGIARLATANGAPLWSARYDAGLYDLPQAAAFSPDGHRVYVSGASQSQSNGMDYVTLAYCIPAPLVC